MAKPDYHAAPFRQVGRLDPTCGHRSNINHVSIVRQALPVKLWIERAGFWAETTSGASEPFKEGVTGP
jgi:hypothetical protein